MVVLGGVVIITDVSRVCDDTGVDIDKSCDHADVLSATGKLDDTRSCDVIAPRRDDGKDFRRFSVGREREQNDDVRTS